MTNNSHTIAKALLDISAVGFIPNNPITFKTGIVSPVYVDNRKFPFFPESWSSVLQGFKDLLEEKNIEYDIIAGIETAGIPHSATLGYITQKPSVFIRKKVKDHGTKSRIEGGKVEGKKVLLIEDHITTGSSSLSGVEALRAEGATVTDCLAITTYDFKEADEAFADLHVTLHTLTTFSIILEEAVTRNILTNEERTVVEAWFRDPHNWKK